MQSKEYFKNKARKIAKQTWAGPGKFGVFILLCIIIVATFESLGLSNRETNLEFRSVQKIVIPIKTTEKTIIEVNDIIESNSNSLNERLKLSSQIDMNNKIIEREKILLNGAMEQNLFENKHSIENFEKLTTDEKIILFYSEICQTSRKYANSEIFFDV